ncbi:MAG: ATP-binding protein [Candidatus Devosia phytovorans]|uniref:histidine kinase n=1 Tax=Candidatus Devosia phytovorans TaxID=3121372 RepID=A0AAJ5VXX8_9HYPH|nr:ATP-binding protein [Devosia sp.]WEK06447.1 MAG: ATP-binding protein [Devosia sp.]
MPWLALAVVCLVLSGVVILVADRYASSQADATLGARLRATTNLQVSALTSALDKQRAVRFVISRDADVIATLAAPDATALDGLNAKLETLNQGAGASVIYIINTDGIAVASSNFREPRSFVGNDYNFRAYYNDAMAGGTGQLFALGSVSRRPGLYIAERIEGPDGPLGVAVVKLEFDELEAMWGSEASDTYVMDSRGVVILSSVRQWRFYMRQAPSASEIASLRDSLQFGEAPLIPLPVSTISPMGSADLVTARYPGTRKDIEAIRTYADVPGTDWTLFTFSTVEENRASAISSARAVGLLSLLVVATGAALLLAYLLRNRRAQRGMQAESARLELAVAARTRDLLQALEDRQQAEAKAGRLRDDLAQSNRLAVLGQIAAGVAHEINQPLGAIRAYSENGRVFAGQRDLGSVDDNLASITALTERIAAITEQFRTFARKGGSSVEPVDAVEAVEAALAMLRHRLARNGIDVTFAPSGRPMPVLADRIGLEQIIVNLVQNAIEALSETEIPRIEIDLMRAGGHVALTILDSGPGIPPDILEKMFVPFNTNKPKGLGLGLVISQELALKFSGTLSANTTTDSGASFTLTLPVAP